MPPWLRVALATATGFVVWFAVATVGNLALRWLLPGYAEVEKAMNFSLVMLTARLAVGAVASLAAGAYAPSARRRLAWFVRPLVLVNLTGSAIFATMPLCTLKSLASSRRSKRLPRARVSANWHVCANVMAAGGGGSGKVLRGCVCP